MNAQVSAYAGICATIADRYSRGSQARRCGAEFDDLYQEGLISVWQALERGVTPSADLIEFRMRDWMRYLNRQSPIPYEAMLPLDEYRLGSEG